MITLKLTWLVLTLVLGTLCAAAGSWTLLALFLAVALLPLLSLPANWIIAKGLRLQLQLPVNLRKGQTEDLILELENAFRLPAGRISCFVVLENILTGAMERQRLSTACAARGRVRIPLEFRGDYCGRIRLTVEQVRVYDCFGVLSVRCPQTASGAVTVQPDTFIQKILISSSHGCPDDSEVYSPYRPGSDLTETFQIREYQEGDHPRQIHWKLTSKLEKLIVRDPSLPITRSVVVFWERTVPVAETAELADLQAEVVVSACKALVEQSVHFTVVWNDTETDLCVMQEIRDMDELVGLLPRLLGARGRVGGVSGVEAFVHAVGEGVFSHILYVAAAPTEQAEQLERYGRLTQLLFSGFAGTHDRAVLVDGGHYAEQLMELEI